jgi:hypothetical protein
MMRRMKHAIRWVAVGAALAYVFDPERGRGRREALRTRALQLIDRAKGSAAQLRADADDALAPTSSPDSATRDGNGSSATPASSGASAS